MQMYGSQWESLAAEQFIIFYYKSCENPYQVLQVTRESVSGTKSHVRASERAMKSKVHMIKSLSP